jgi:hypothetical protein
LDDDERYEHDNERYEHGRTQTSTGEHGTRNSDVYREGGSGQAVSQTALPVDGE